MGKFIKKPIEIEAITFDELVAYGKENTDNLVNGMPWSFEYKGHPITHETNACYLIPTLEGTHNMTPEDVLITGVRGEIYPCKIDIFKETYDSIPNNISLAVKESRKFFKRISENENFALNCSYSGINCEIEYKIIVQEE